MRIAIVMTAYNREAQMRKTLESFRQYDPYDYVVVVERDEDHLHKTWCNSSVPFNKAFDLTLNSFNPPIDAVIIQNAECFHAGDILGYVQKNLTETNYISFPCYSLAKDDTIPPIEMYPKGASFDGESAWYNHPRFRPVGYHFCAAITAANLRKINGFDERFKDGIGYDDDYFLHQVRSLGLRVDLPPEPYVFHQWHYGNKLNTPELIRKNAELFKELSLKPEHKAKHLITPDL